MPEIRCRPIDHWDGPYTYDPARRRAPFDAGFNRVLRDLEREFGYLDAHDVTVGLDVRPGDIRQDGWPYARSVVPPPVSLTFVARRQPDPTGPIVGPLRYQCDRWDSWHGNLRAIGLTLQRLRLVDEGGCTRSGEQYRGWSALPPGRAMAAAMTADEAAVILADAAGVEQPFGWYDDPDAIRLAWRRASRTRHPDAGGDPAEFRRLTEARDLLLKVGSG